MSKGLFVVTGASSGIGQAVAWVLAKEHTVIACGRDGKKMAHTLRDQPNILPYLGDLADALAIDPLVQLVRKQNLPLLGLVNNAGAYRPGLFKDASDEVWVDQFVVNLLSAVRVTRELYPDLKKSQGSVVNVSSTLGVRPVAGTSAYSASKAAMVNWTKTVALEWAEDKIRVNCICPGLVDTPIHSFHALADSSEEKQSAHAAQPLRRMGEPREIAWAVEFLLSEKSAWTTGSVLTVDGGIQL